MPQITVDYSADLADDFDRPGFAKALHEATVEIAAAKPPACKTRFRRTEDVVVGPETEGHAHVHVHLALLSGRTDETKARLTEATLDLVRKYVKAAEGVVLHASAEVRDLDASYRKFEA
ncbi:5-carboxymethyl-2-hydroxymuconate Delta-isomerase [Streptomyces lomondensis]|uniref:Isomerase n=1 Tax=Streptomyces lomondensis TaxID=68229 RepID=A0ABQ2WYC3_9ACTN|nr:5-carboxymethyl-2-hydroxymuconate Delta-isomerase [Streptomyces lomondensis]MCF0079198.1 5-carboxymethyl-2-hydroxymuconate Delta-isomerase [Streptomyces lomondensis]GGW83221.1 isomerase [Streptomyces lomondensis]